MAKNTQESAATRNKVEVCGILKENKTVVDKDKINGSLVIQYGKKPDQQVEVQIYVARKKKDGETNKKYDQMKEKLESLVSKAQATDEASPSRLRIYGNKIEFSPHVKLDEYYNENTGEIAQTLKIEMGFGNMYTGDIDEDQFKGEFEMVVTLAKNPVKEVKDDEETGRLLVDAYYVDHKGAIKPVSFVVEDEDLVSGIEDCVKGETIEFWGDIKIAKITETKTKQSKLGGKAKTDEKTITHRELVITGGNPIEEDEVEYIDLKFVKTALGEREAFLEELKKGDKDKTKEKGKGKFAGKAKVEADDEEIPF